MRLIGKVRERHQWFFRSLGPTCDRLKQLGVTNRPVHAKPAWSVLQQYQHANVGLRRIASAQLIATEES